MAIKRRTVFVVACIGAFLLVLIALGLLRGSGTAGIKLREPTSIGDSDSQESDIRSGRTRLSRLSNPDKESLRPRQPLLPTLAEESTLAKTGTTNTATQQLQRMAALQFIAEQAARRRMANGYVPAPQIPEEEQGKEIGYMVSRATADMRSVATAVESYMVDNAHYPISTTSTRGSLLHASGPAGPVPTFLNVYAASEELARPPSSITTPIAYLTRYMQDPFGATPGETFAYYSKEEGGAYGWVVFSPGPDGDYDFDWELYSPLVSAPTQEHAMFSYDSTNGLLSNGDLLRFNR